MTTKFETLKKEIIARSESKDWDKAKTEWTLSDIYKLPPGESSACLCGHSPIREICIIENTKNSISIDVGNCCVQKFEHIKSNNQFKSIQRVTKDIKKSLNIELVELVYEKGIINIDNLKFYKDIHKRHVKNLHPNSLKYKTGLNTKILEWINKNKHTP